MLVNSRRKIWASVGVATGVMFGLLALNYGMDPRNFTPASVLLALAVVFVLGVIAALVQRD